MADADGSRGATDRPALSCRRPDATATADTFNEELVVRPIGDRHVEATWLFGLEFRPKAAHLCARYRGGLDDDSLDDKAHDAGPELCHFELFPQDISDLLYLSGDS
jgi:hypothetical protein